MSAQRLVRISLLSIIGALASTAFAQEVRLEKNISLALAGDAANAAVQFCKDKGWAVSAAVVDRSGQLRALLRADGAAPHTIDASRRKAFTALSMRNNTSNLLENIQKNPAAANISLIDGFLVLGGGMPVRIGDDVIAAIGVSGSPGGNLDDLCAEAGIRKIRERLQ